MLDNPSFEFGTAKPKVSPKPALIADLFAGGGGASAGASTALGRCPDVAINHDPVALSMHEANHPSTRHLTSSVWAVDPRDLIETGQPVGFAWFSPDCKHFSRAKGGKPVEKNIRDLAWVVVNWDKRGLQGLPPRWGPHAERTRTKTWGNPIRWQKKAKANGIRDRVFCASLADVFDNHKSILPAWRKELWELIRQCPDLDFLMLTKRPQNITRYLPQDWGQGYPNVWLGATVESQQEADRLAHLVDVPAVVHFLSMEPLMGPVDLSAHIARLEWVITGGESGKNYRPVNPDWFRSLRDQCNTANVPFLFKQWEGETQKIIKAKGRKLDGVLHDGYPEVAAVR